MGVQVPGAFNRFLNLRVQVQLVPQAVLRTDAMFRSFMLIEPPVGLAARKLSGDSSSVRPARVALLRSTRPLPTSSTVHGVVPSCSTPVRVAVVWMADLISIGDQLGCTARTSAPEPARCGEDIDVPLSRP